MKKSSSSAVKLDKEVLKNLKSFCESKGYKQGAFVEKAIRLQMEREDLQEDILDLVSLRPLEAVARPFAEYDRQR